VVFLTLYDVGRSIDTKAAAALVPGTQGMGVIRRRDTPHSLSMPTPLCVDLRAGMPPAPGDVMLEDLSVTARIYEDGVISMVVRLDVAATLEELHGIEHKRLENGIRDLESYVDDRFRAVFDLVKPAISFDHYETMVADRETYTAYCFADVGASPQEFVLANTRALSTLISGEPFGAPLHDSQIRKTLSDPFSYADRDLAIFDMDACLIIDADRDYEDVLLICELANYQFLELRSLDRLLDRWLDEAEDDLRFFYSKRGRKDGRLKVRSGALKKKVAGIQGLRLDALFILENVENSSKIIGDYFLGQAFEQLCGIFNTPEWTRSVERRIDALQDIYDIVKGERNEQNMLTLEIIFIVVCIIPIIQFMLAK